MSCSTHPCPAPAVRDAATVAVLADRPDAPGHGLVVLLLRRADSHVFGAGADVFPGGAIDNDDRLLASRLAGDALSSVADTACRIAALRECFEEAGLLIGAMPALPDAATRARVRAALCTGRIDWAAAQAELGVACALDALVGFAHWTTPSGAPKRYAARFFAVAAPAGAVETADADGHETVAAEWLAPQQALADADAGRRLLMTPTRAALARLAGYDSVAAALTGLADSAIRNAAVDR